MAGEKNKRTGLGGAFSPAAATPTRGEGLDNILRPSRPTSTPEDAKGSEADQTSSQPQTTGSQAGTERATPRLAGERAKSRSRKRNLSVYITDTVYDALRSRAHQTGLSYAELAVEAFNSVQQIDALFLPVSAAVTSEDEIPAAPVSAADRFPAGTNLVNIRFTDEQRAWIDKQWIAKGAASRSRFVATVLTVFLTGDDS